MITRLENVTLVTPGRVFPGSALDVEGEKILVVCSFSDKPHIFPAPTGFDFDKAELILNNYNEMEHHLLKPYETRVYLWRS